MLILFIITSVLYLLMVGFVLYLYYTYHKDYEELENRLLQLEKRINEVEQNNDMLGEYYERTNVIENIQEQNLNRLLELEKRLSKKVYKDLSKEELEDLRERWENEYFNWINKPEHMVIDNLPGGKIGIKDKKNNTNKEGEDNMACKKGRGGRKK